MNLRGIVAVLALALSLAAAPSLAVAQSAGDDQYVDPLNGVTGGGSGSGGGSAGTGSAGSASSGSTAPGSPAGATPALPGQLARTGYELPLTAGAGLLLLVGGLGLRRFSGARR